jgi:hypothetical protein
MAGALSAHAPSGFAAHYEAGMIASKDGSSLSLVDAWVDVNDGINNEWLWALATELQPKILAVIS